MARGTSVNYTGALSFTYATTGPDLFKMTDVQSLAQAVELHTHDAAGKGLGVAGTAIKTAIDMPDWFRSTGHTSAYPAAGQGLEMFYEPGSGGLGIVQAYNRGASQFMPLQLMGSSVGLYAGAGSAALTISNTGTTVLSFPVTCNQDLAVGGATHLTGQLTCNGITCAGINSSAAVSVTGNFSASGTATVGNLTTTGTASVGALTTPNAVSAGQYNIGTGGSYILPLNPSIRYMSMGGGEHSFEALSGNSQVRTNNLVVTNQVIGNLVHSGAMIALGPAVSSGGLCIGSEVGQGNGAASVLPLQRGTGFGPAGGAGVGWVKFMVGATVCYFPYWN
jgi:hypothetical protein